jgi:hypothetical protein
MLKWRNLILVFGLTLILLIGCTKTKGSKPGEYFPLTKGNQWQYQGEGNEYASFTREVLFTKDKHAQVIEDNGGTVSMAIFETTDSAVIRIFFKGESYEKENLLDRKPNDSLTIIKAPLKVGTSWIDQKSTREIVALDAKVTTPAGEFTDCLKIKAAEGNSTLYEYYKKGIGLIKREFHVDDMIVSSQLEKYEVKEK